MKHSLKSIVISLLLSVVALPSLGCIWMGTHNYYLFSIYDSNEFSSRADRVCAENWRAYLGVSTDNEYYYFDMKEAKERVQMKGDQLMGSYLEHLESYLDCAREVMYEQWDYPTKEQLAQRQQTLERVRAYAEGKLKTRLRSQHALLFMRCNMLLQRHAENVTFWEQTASQFIETIYKEMMYDIYAGALLHTGRGDEAAQIFAELGDWKSLMTQFYKRRSCQAISEEYHRDPNSAVLPFLLQDFVNNAQEAVDGLDEDGALQGKLFVRDIEKQEAQQMCRLAEEAVGNPATRCPLMWQTARAWLEYLFGDGKKALSLIRKTDGMEGNQQMKDCARAIGFYLSAATGEGATRTFDDYVTRELKWLEAMSDSSYFCQCARERVVYQALVPRYEDAGRQETALALLNAVGAWQYEDCLDTMSVAALQRFADYAHSTGLGTLDRHLAKSIRLDENAFADLMGTKLLRLCQWRKAQQWLARVPVSFYAEKGYAPYAAFRRWAVEPWLKRQWLPSYMEYSGVDKDLLLANPKLVFAQEMETMEADLNVLTGNGRELRCYDLAVRYAQASFTGDCWYLMRDSKSVGDTVRANETDLQAKARKLLAEAARSKNTKLRERALFALAYGGLYPEGQWWYEYEWDSKLMKSVRMPQHDRQQYRALSALAVFSKQAPVSDYVSRCDEYKQFCKHFK